MTEWLSALYRVVQNKEAKENLFRSKPKPPIIIFEDPKLSADNKNYIVNLICSFCDRLEYEGQNVPTNKPLIISKDIYEISLSASNSFVKNVVYKLTLQTKSLYCIHCGKKFEEPSDVFCTQCGSKRI